MRRALAVGMLGALIALQLAPPLLHVGAPGPPLASAPSLLLILPIFVGMIDSSPAPCCCTQREFGLAHAPSTHSVAVTRVDHVAVATSTDSHMLRTHALADMHGFEVRLPCVATPLHIAVLFAS
jgi:hypothetical protein